MSSALLYEPRLRTYHHDAFTVLFACVLPSLSAPGWRRTSSRVCGSLCVSPKFASWTVTANHRSRFQRRARSCVPDKCGRHSSWRYGRPGPAGVPTIDRSAAFVSSVGASKPGRFAVDQTLLAQHLQNPLQHLSMGLHIQPAPRPRDTEMIRRPPPQLQAQKLPQRKRIGTAPRNPRSESMPSK